MSFRADEYDLALERAAFHARAWLLAEETRPIPPPLDTDAVIAAADTELRLHSTPAADVVDELVRTVEPGLMSMGSGRFFGWVIGGGLPAAVAADWLVSTWDQNSALRYATPGVVGVEEIASSWLLDLLGLAPTCDVGFVTGATMANFTGLSAGRHHVLREAGWDVNRDGLTGAPRVTVIGGDDRHITVDLALRYLGLGLPTAVAVDDQGRVIPSALAAALDNARGPVIVALQAGNLHSGAFDPFAECISIAHARGAWVHIDGAFGLWAGAAPSLRHLIAGYEEADSFATDAHKTLNTPYDSGIAIVRHPDALRAAMGASTAYLPASATTADPVQLTPEFSRRARGVPVWAALRSLGRDGVAGLVAGLAARAGDLARGIAEVPGAQILNDVVYTQISVAFESDERTREITDRLLAEGVTWMSGSHWRGRDVMRVSVSNWSTDAADVSASVEAVRRAAS